MNSRIWDEGRAVLESWGVDVVGVETLKKGPIAQAIRCLLHGRPWINRAFDPAMARAVMAELEEGGWDLVQAESIFSAQHLPRPLNVGSILIARDCLSAIMSSKRETPRARLQRGKVVWMERTLYGRFDAIATISASEHERILRLCPSASVAVTPNGVDLDAFRPDVDAEQEGTIVFTGAMDYGPNVDACCWFVEQVWPRVRSDFPEAQFLIVGRDPTAAVRALAAVPGVEVTGTVERIQDWMVRACVVVSPLRYGGGIKNKVLEGAAMGKALVATPLSLQDIQLKPGEGVLVAETPQEFASQIVRLLGDTVERRRLGEVARQAVERHYAWETYAERLWSCYQRVVEQRSQ